MEMSNQSSPADASDDTARSALDSADGKSDSPLRRAGQALVAPFYNHRQGRVRAFWRVLVPLLVFLAGSQVVASVIGPRFGMTAGSLLMYSLRAALVVGLLIVWARYVDRRTVSAYGIHFGSDSLQHLLAGLVIGIGIHALALVVFLAGGWVEVTGFVNIGAATLPFTLVVLGWTVAWVCVGISEELLFRGLFIPNAAEGLGHLSNRAALIGAWAVSSAVFAVVHFSQVTSPVAFLFWSLIGGGLLGTAYVVTGDLALPLGLHIAYNFAGNTLFGLTMVESERVPSVLDLTFTGPNAIVGIPGAVNAATVVVGIAATLAWVRYRCGGLDPQTDLAAWESRD
jgi:membrane protease YdiL (CAAX protease family)